MASENIISRLTTRLNQSTSQGREMPDVATRNIGGSFRTNHPYISGYFYVMFSLPETLFSSNSESASKWLSTTVESFTPPSETINSTEITGLGQVKARFYTSRTVTNDITLAFREYQNLPILNTLNQWVKKPTLNKFCLFKKN